jgi:hypothetical protein
MAQHDIQHIGDSQELAWRDFDKKFITDGFNDYLKTIELTNEVRPGKSFTISLWSEFLTLKGSVYPHTFCSSFYAISTNNLLGLSRNTNEIMIGILPGTIRAYCLSKSTDLESSLRVTGGDIPFPIILNKKFHICFTNNYDGVNNNWVIYVNSIKRAFGTDYVASITSPPASGIVIPPDPNYLSGIGFYVNRNILPPYNPPFQDYSNQKTNEFIITQNVLTETEVRELYHSGQGNYGNYPNSIMTNQLLHLPMNNASDFYFDGVNLRANDISVGNNDPIITGQGAVATLANFY